MQAPTTSRKPPTWGAVLFFAATLLVSRLLSGDPANSNVRYEQELKQAPWAPPGWLFGPAWTINNILLIRALWKLLRQPVQVRSDRQLLALQAGIWLVFCTFGYVYFRKGSPLLAAVWTQTDAVLALTSLLIARKKGRGFAAHYAPLLLWTAFASTVAWYQAAYNDDRVLGTPALKEVFF